MSTQSIIATNTRPIDISGKHRFQSETGALDGCKVTILMAIYNGATTLPEQLESFARQSHRNWHLIASDDGSDDTSRDCVTDFAAQGHSVRLLDGPGKGAAENFMALIRTLPVPVPANSWLAFSDQDDVWLEDKVTRGLEMLAQNVPDDVPAVYCSRTWICDAELKNRRLSAPRPHPPGFCNALVQNITSGNTILLNPAGTKLVCAAALEARDVVAHDWWVYQLITGCGGKILHDDKPGLLYRQHGNNLVGANDGFWAKMVRLRRLLDGDFREWNTSNIVALRRSSAWLLPENKACLETFAEMRESSLLQRLRIVRRLGLYRQSRSSTIALWVAAFLKKL